MTAPLNAIRAVELSGIGPGTYCGMLPAKLGADVVLVTRPGEATRRADSVAGRGRRAVVADLKDRRRNTEHCSQDLSVPFREFGRAAVTHSARRNASIDDRTN